MKKLFIVASVFSCLLQNGASADQLFGDPVLNSYQLSYCQYNVLTCASSTKYHSGVDYHGDTSYSVIASNDGIIAKVEYMSSTDHGMGNNVIIKHQLTDGSVIYSSYSHLSSIKSGLIVGANVNKGDFIGYIGGSGYGSATYWDSHLHFEIKDSAVTNNPSGSSYPYWGYMPSNPDNYGYHNPNNYIGKVSVTGAATSNISAFDGAGSLVRPNENCWGCNKDEAMMHAGRGKPSTVVFQWYYDPNTCEHVDVRTEPNISTVAVQARNWSDHFTKTGFASTLPVSIPRQGQWTIFSVTSTAPVTSDVAVFAECRSSSNAKVGNPHPFSNPNLVEFENSYFWSGNGSVISRSNQTGVGGTGDDAITFTGTGHNSITVFQWDRQNNCSKLSLTESQNRTVPANVSIKHWATKEFGGDICTQLPCTVTAGTNNYYLVKIKSTPDAVASGHILASCTN